MIVRHRMGRHMANQATGKARNLRRFADALADSSPGASIAQVAAQAGVSQQTGSVYFREICRGLGWQAQ